MRICSLLSVSVLVVLVSPLALCVALISIFVQGPPLLFRQKRVGKNGKAFILYKFRTMRAGAEREQRNYVSLNEAHGPVFKIYDDPRYTAIGKFLAHTGLDELPQLYNVLRGDMAIFGPRPLPVSEERNLSSWQKKREKILPGIISPAIMGKKYHMNFDDWMRSDIAYANSKNIQTDIRLFFKTLIFMSRLFIRILRKTLINEA